MNFYNYYNWNHLPLFGRCTGTYFNPTRSRYVKNKILKTRRKKRWQISNRKGA